MALSDKTNLLVRDYIRQQYPTLEEGVQQYLDDELARIELALASVTRAAIQVADDAPEKSREGHGPLRRLRLGPPRRRKHRTDGLQRHGMGGRLSTYTRNQTHDWKHSRERGRRFFR